jgi:hypothetical protein
LFCEETVYARRGLAVSVGRMQRSIEQPQPGWLPAVRRCDAPPFGRMQT